MGGTREHFLRSNSSSVHSLTFNSPDHRLLIKRQSSGTSSWTRGRSEGPHALSRHPTLPESPQGHRRGSSILPIQVQCHNLSSLNNVTLAFPSSHAPIPALNNTDYFCLILQHKRDSFSTRMRLLRTISCVCLR